MLACVSSKGVCGNLGEGIERDGLTDDLVEADL